MFAIIMIDQTKNATQIVFIFFKQNNFNANIFFSRKIVHLLSLSNLIFDVMITYAYNTITFLCNFTIGNNIKCFLDLSILDLSTVLLIRLTEKFLN